MLRLDELLHFGFVASESDQRAETVLLLHCPGPLVFVNHVPRVIDSDAEIHCPKHEENGAVPINHKLDYAMTLQREYAPAHHRRIGKFRG